MGSADVKTSLRLKLHKQGLEAIAKSKAAADATRRAGEAVHRNLRPASEYRNEPVYVVNTEIGEKRAHTFVATGNYPAMLDTAYHHTLQNALHKTL